MTPREIIRYATVMATLEVERHKRSITLEYMNAALQRAKKMPPVKELIADRKPPKLAEIMAAFGSAKKKEK